MEEIGLCLEVAQGPQSLARPLVLGAGALFGLTAYYAQWLIGFKRGVKIPPFPSILFHPIPPLSLYSY